MMPAASVGPPSRLPRGWRWAAVVVALVYPTLLTWVYFSLLAYSSPGLQQGVYSAGKAIQFGVPLVWVLAIERRRLAFAGPRWMSVIVGLASGLLIAATMLIAYSALSGTPQLGSAAAAVRARLGSIGFSSPVQFILLGLFYAGFHSLLEEYYWRWFVFGRLQELVSPAAAIVISSLGFMAHHVIVLMKYFPGVSVRFPSPLAIALSLAVAIAGGFWAWLYHRTASLYGPWLSHMLADAAIFAVGYQMIYG